MPKTFDILSAMKAKQTTGMDKFQQYLKEHGISIVMVARACDINRQSVYNKIARPNMWSAGEISAIATAFAISQADILRFFFADK